MIVGVTGDWTMPKEAVLQIRIDSSLKEAAESLYHDMGTTFSEAVRMFARQSVLVGGMPFALRAGLSRTASSGGVFSAYANPALREKEKDAFAHAMEAKQ